MQKDISQNTFALDWVLEATDSDQDTKTDVDL